MAISGIGNGNVLQQVFGRLGPGGFGNDGIWKNALRACSATRRVVWLVRGNRVAEFLGEKTGEIGAANRSGERAGLVVEITSPIRERRDGNQAGVDALVRPGSLIVGEEKHLVLADRSTHRPPNWFCRKKPRSGEK